MFHVRFVLVSIARLSALESPCHRSRRFNSGWRFPAIYDRWVGLAAYR